ncbi:trigger factor, partial [Lactobacillaceae bacterium Scapto_B20]
ANMQQQGINAEMYFQLTGTTREEMKKNFADGASRRVKTNLVLEAIVEAEDIKPTDEQVDEEVKTLSKQYGMGEDAIRGALSTDMLKHDIAIQSAVKLITDSAKQDKPASKKSKSDSEK